MEFESYNNIANKMKIIWKYKMRTRLVLNELIIESTQEYRRKETDLKSHLKLKFAWADIHGAITQQ